MLMDSLSKDAKLLPYTPSKLTFQFIGDSLSAVSIFLTMPYCLAVKVK